MSRKLLKEQWRLYQVPKLQQDIHKILFSLFSAKKKVPLKKKNTIIPRKRERRWNSERKPKESAGAIIAKEMIKTGGLFSK